jgi:hypothetical protein
MAARGRGKFRVLERAFGEYRGISRRDQPDVALARRHPELLRQMQQHLAARGGATGLEKAQVARGDLGLARQRQLTEVPPLPPFANLSSDGLRGHALEG